LRKGVVVIIPTASSVRRAVRADARGRHWPRSRRVGAGSDRQHCQCASLSLACHRPPGGPDWVHETLGLRFVARDGRAADPSAGRCFILRPFPLMGPTKLPARNDRTRCSSQVRGLPLSPTNRLIARLEFFTSEDFRSKIEEWRRTPYLRLPRHTNKVHGSTVRCDSCSVRGGRKVGWP
jgi:hypothetical protein